MKNIQLAEMGSIFLYVYRTNSCNYFIDIYVLIYMYEGTTGIVTGTSKFLFHYKKRNLKSTKEAESTVWFLPSKRKKTGVFLTERAIKILKRRKKKLLK